MKKENFPCRFATQIQNTSECAFQRAIIEGQYSLLNGEKIEWLDIEIPVDYSGNARGKSLDLIGMDSKGNYVLVELKFRKGSRDNGNPEEAAFQLKEYLQYIKQNYSHLHGHSENGKPIDWEKVANGKTRLVVSANKRYWESWFGPRRKGVKYDITGVECYSVDVEQDEFINQRGEMDTYSPKFPSKDQLIWEKK